MPTYAHFQDVKKALDLPHKDKVGVCLTCRYWDVEEHRTPDIAARVSRCLQPELKNYALIVSGSSACNKWQEKPDVAPEATAYAKHGGDA